MNKYIHCLVCFCALFLFLSNISIASDSVEGGVSDADRLAIQAIITDSTNLLDHGQVEAFANYFVKNGTMGLVGKKPLSGRKAIRARYEAMPDNRTTRHFSTGVRLVSEGSDKVRGFRTATFFAADKTATAGPILSTVVDYEEVYTKGEDGHWRFVSRLVSPVPGVLLPIP